MVKAVVNVDRRIMAISAELHADEEAALLEDGSRQAALWGINLYPNETGDPFVEFDSMINVRRRRGTAAGPSRMIRSVNRSGRSSGYW
jgi:hypothetical protein